MKRRYSGFLGEPGFSGARRKKIKGDFSCVPNSIESRFMGLVVANNGDLPGNVKVKKQLKRYTKKRIGFDVILVSLFVVLWIFGYFFYD